MPKDLALERYLGRHIEPGLPQLSRPPQTWQHALVIPAYREAPALLDQLARHAPEKGLLSIVVLNQPRGQFEPQANAALQAACQRLPQHLTDLPAAFSLLRLNEAHDLLLCNMDYDGLGLPAEQGVGLARKTGCDIALAWMAEGHIRGDWIGSTDADAILPMDYFQRLQGLAPGSAAACLPFSHSAGESASCNRATGLYELRLHHYVYGLEQAGSPYAFHSLGSCLAIHRRAYAQVRGFPKRSAAEDFYILGKLAKVGKIARPAGQTIQLASRFSDRVPFGTGPATQQLAASEDPASTDLLYHPACFSALQALINSVQKLREQKDSALPGLLKAHGLDEALSEATCRALAELGLARALSHCRRQSSNTAQFLRHFHQWFDAFRSLKFIHALRDAGWQDYSYREFCSNADAFWPEPVSGDINRDREAFRRHWGWL